MLNRISSEFPILKRISDDEPAKAPSNDDDSEPTAKAKSNMDEVALQEFTIQLHQMRAELIKKIDKVETGSHESRNILEAKLKKNFKDSLAKTQKTIKSSDDSI